MAKLRSVNTAIWVDKFITNSDPTEKLLFLYLLINPFTRLSGCYEITVRQIAFDTGIDSEMVLKIFGRFQTKKKLIYRDEWVVLPNFLKNQNLNDNMKKCVVAELADAPAWVTNTIATIIESSETLRKAFESFQILRKVEVESEDEAEDETEGGSARVEAPKRENPPPEKPKVSDFGARQQIPTDPNFLHPAIKHLREMTGHDPPKESKPLLIAALGTDFDVGRLAECYARWRAANYKASNFNFVLDWYKNGIPEKGNGISQNGNPNGGLQGSGRTHSAETIARIRGGLKSST